jgi:hypothetical protein
MFETKKLRAKILEQDQERAKGVMSALSRNSTKTGDAPAVEDIPVDRFDLSFRILGNEIFGMSLTSQSRWKKWTIFGVMILVVMATLLQVLSPMLIEFWGTVGV